MELDDRLTFSSAEGVDLDLVLAGLGSRAAALALDLVIQLVTLAVVGLVAAPFGDAGIAVLAVGSFLVLFGYPILSEAMVGQTLGKAAFGLAVVRTDGTPVRFLGAVIRNVVRVIDVLPGPYAVGFIAVLATKRSQRLGDLAAGTLVIHQRRRAPAATATAAWGSISSFGPGAGAGPDPDVAAWDVSMVTAEETAAARAFLTRRHQLDPVRRQQLAVTLADQLLAKVAGVPTDQGPEGFLEAVVTAKSLR